MIWLVAPNETWSSELSDVLTGQYAVRRIASIRSFSRLLQLGETPKADEFLCLIHFSPEHSLPEVHAFLSMCLTSIKNTQVCVVGDLTDSQHQILDVFKVSYLSLVQDPNQIARQLREIFSSNQRYQGPSVTDRLIKIGDIEVDRDQARMRVAATGLEEPLTPKEVRILYVLALAANKTIGRDDLIKAVWPGVRVSASTIDSHMSRLRKKIEQSFECRLETHYGSGWKIAVRSQATD
jgi:DNA-binding response OmpR family regulator